MLSFRNILIFHAEKVFRSTLLCFYFIFEWRMHWHCKLSWQKSRRFRANKKTWKNTVHRISSEAGTRSNTARRWETMKRPANIKWVEKKEREKSVTWNGCQDYLNVRKTSYALGHFHIGHCNCENGRVSLVFIRRKHASLCVVRSVCRFCDDSCKAHLSTPPMSIARDVIIRQKRLDDWNKYNETDDFPI